MSASGRNSDIAKSMGPTRSLSSLVRPGELADVLRACPGWCRARCHDNGADAEQRRRRRAGAKVDNGLVVDFHTPDQRAFRLLAIHHLLDQRRLLRRPLRLICARKSNRAVPTSAPGASIPRRPPSVRLAVNFGHAGSHRWLIMTRTTLDCLQLLDPIQNLVLPPWALEAS